MHYTELSGLHQSWEMKPQCSCEWPGHGQDTSLVSDFQKKFTDYSFLPCEGEPQYVHLPVSAQGLLQKCTFSGEVSTYTWYHCPVEPKPWQISSSTGGTRQGLHKTRCRGPICQWEWLCEGQTHPNNHTHINAYYQPCGSEQFGWVTMEILRATSSRMLLCPVSHY